MATRRTLIAGNWKMNGLAAATAELDAVAAGAAALPGIDLVICPPATLVAGFAARAGSAVAIGGQDCHTLASGAHTGDISAEMLADAGARYVIVGHSERRADHGETNAVVRAKAGAAGRAGLTAIVCIGETLEEREAGEVFAVLAHQLAESLPETASGGTIVVAYEPIWAIGTSVTPTTAEIGEVHAFLRARLVARFGNDGAAIRLLYGGSVKPTNAAEILAVDEVDGALVGGASLKAVDFLAIAQGAPSCQTSTGTTAAPI